MFLRSVLRWFGSALAVVLVSLPVHAQEPAAPEGVAYTVELLGLAEDDTGLRQQFEAVSLLSQLSASKPATVAALRRRGQQDLERLNAVLKSQGYYEAETALSVERPSSTTPEAIVRLTVTSGPQYRIGTVHVADTSALSSTPANEPQMTYIGVVSGQPALAEPMLDATDRLQRQYQLYGFPFAAVRATRFVLQQQTRTLDARYEVEPGLPAVFGTTVIDGLVDVDIDYVLKLIPWQPGETYSIDQLEAAQRRLVRTNLFDAVNIKPIRFEGNATGGTPVPVNISVTVVERRHRSIGFGAFYATDEGPGATAFWEHRNFAGSNESFRSNLTVSSLERSVDANFRKPFFLREGQALLVNAELRDLNTDAFDEVRLASFIGVERELSEDWTLTVGPTLDFVSQDTDISEEDALILAGLRTSLKYDTTDDFLDPTRGVRLQLDGEPFHDFGGANETFFSTAAVGSAYVSLDSESRFVLAGRSRVGTILGAERDEVPAANLFFAGGGGSVRAFGFQRLGPLDGELDPLGGRSVVELGLEARVRIFEDFGIVPFIEGGNVYEEDLPPLEELDIQWGAGFGIRYYTAVGPIRADIAFPLDRRENIDDDFQIYVSLGQAF